MEPETKYAYSGDVAIAYQVVGDGPLDLVWVPNRFTQMEHLADLPVIARFFERLASFARVISFDRRGSGMSDRAVEMPTLEEEMDDIRAVMAAVGSQRAAVAAQLEAGPMAMLFAATFPEMTGALILYAAFARVLWAPDYDWAPKPEERTHSADLLIDSWGTGVRLAAAAPSMAGDPRVLQWFGKLERLSVTPGTVREFQHKMAEIDVRHVLPMIRVPTLVLHRRDDPFMNPLHSRYIAEHIPGARLVELDGVDNFIAAGDSDAIADEIEEFLTGTRQERTRTQRVLATVMFTDIVGSTERASEMGDRRWRELLESHDVAVRRELERFDGREVKRTGDGFLATFDGPARGIRCATRIREATAPLGIELRTGLHAGECELMGDDVGGMAVHIGARVMGAAGANEVLVSSTVKDLVVGSGIDFADRGVHPLKGVPGEWHLFAVDGAG
ncbi:MAG TPA: adenylate/guanylate cyclase domain-containing protein [Solirubrobacteraceae bacterium]|nr:adenylate/guanylate cyclase domain-containing protein [Solirubrobacteraceae bacterium]